MLLEMDKEEMKNKMRAEIRLQMAADKRKLRGLASKGLDLDDKEEIKDRRA